MTVTAAAATTTILLPCFPLNANTATEKQFKILQYTSHHITEKDF